MRLPAVALAAICLVAPSAFAIDADGDLIDDAVDNCLGVDNPNQIDADNDGIGNLCDADFNNDCAVNVIDLGVMRLAFFSSDPEVDLDSSGNVNFQDLGLLRALFFNPPGPSAQFGVCSTASELPASASSDPGLQAPALAVDNNINTRWETFHGVDPGVLTLDLGAVYPLQRVDIHWEAANARVYSVEGSSDGTTWLTLGGVNNGAFGDRSDQIDVVGSYRYVRMNGQARSSIYGYSIWEMDVFGDAGAAVPIDDQDGDGVVDAEDLCPDTPPGSTVDQDGCIIVPSVSEAIAGNGILVGGPGSSRPGFALYVFDNDLGISGSSCNGDCAQTWPPLLVTDGTASGAAELGQIERDDGTMQATYQGRPLYFYSGDDIVSDTNGQGLGNVWWLVPYTRIYEPLFDASTPLEPALQEDTPTALITRFADRARDRHAREDQFQAYDHYLAFYWEHRTATIEIIDPIGKGGDTITFNVTTQWPLSSNQAELRFFYRGINTVAEYYNNGVMTPLGDLNYTRSVSFNPKTNNALQVGDRLEFELSQFLSGVPRGRNNYYGTAMLYIVGQGIVPWEARGVFGDASTEREDSYPIAAAGRSGGGTTLSYQYSDEPDNHFLQMATNLAPQNGQKFVLGRRVHHTDFGDGSHNESNANPAFGELAGLLGPAYGNRSCVACHVRNGRALAPAAGAPLTQHVVRVGDETGAPHPLLGQVLQPLSTSGSPEGSVAIETWLESDGLRRPVYSFTPQIPQRFSVRLAPQLVGMGLLEAIPESAIEALADPDDQNADGVSGRLQRVVDPVSSQMRVGRFGWKAGQASVRDQVAAALNTDIGVMTSVFPAPDCGSSQSNCGAAAIELDSELLEQLTAYISLLGVRARRDLDDPLALQGETLFASIGCAACHTPSHQTSAFHPHAELRAQTIYPYTDLLLHDMGDGLADSLGEGEASGAEWRTPPLWGIGLGAGVSEGAAYLHDGRARTLDEAIRWHGGEGATAQQAYLSLTTAQRSAILAFLNSL